MKKLLQISLLAFVAVALGLWAWGRWMVPHDGATDSAAATVDITQSEVAQPPSGPEHVVRVTYYTTDVRCDSCRQIEALTRQTVTERFADEVAAGLVVFSLCNIDQAENAHFATDYALSFKTVVISDEWNGEERSWVKMDQVWQLLGDQSAFMDYLSEAIQASVGFGS